MQYYYFYEKTEPKHPYKLLYPNLLNEFNTCIIVSNFGLVSFFLNKHQKHDKIQSKTTS